MKFLEKELVDKLINDVIHNTSKRDEVIEDLTEKEAYNLIEKYSGYNRILLTFPKHLLNNKDFILNCEINYGINSSLYVDESLLADKDYVLYKVEKDKFIFNRLVKSYDILPKEENYFIPIVELSIKCKHYKEISNFIDKILENKDLESHRKLLAELNRNLKIMASKSNKIITEILKIGTIKSIKKQVKNLKNKDNYETKNLQA